MKRILAKHTLVEFWTKRPDAKVHLQYGMKRLNLPTGQLQMISKNFMQRLVF